MTQHYPDYTTITDIRAYLGTTDTAEDTLFADLIRATSRDIDALGGRRYYPSIETRTFDGPGGYTLFFDTDLLELTTLANPSGTTIASSGYTLLPYNEYPKFAVQLLRSASLIWQPNSSGTEERSVEVAGIWGCHFDYATAWLDISATLAAAITSTTATTFTCTTGKVRAGDLLKTASEYIYASSVSTGATDTVTCIRGVNGSTAATHLISTALYRWYFPEIQTLCTEAVVARHRLKNNPVGERVQLDAYTFSTPQDVQAYIERRLTMLGLVSITNFYAHD